MVVEALIREISQEHVDWLELFLIKTIRYWAFSIQVFHKGEAVPQVFTLLQDEVQCFGVFVENVQESKASWQDGKEHLHDCLIVEVLDLDLTCHYLLDGSPGDVAEREVG